MSKKNTYSKSIQQSGNIILSNMGAICNSRVILYFILVLALTNLFYLVTSTNYMFASIFILVGFITSFFSKNMIVILCIALTVTNVLQYGNKAAMEGFEATDESTEDDTVKSTVGETKQTKPANPANPITESAVSSKTDTTTKPSKPDADAQTKMDGMLNSYKELLNLQGQIQDGMANINGPLSKAETIVQNMAAQMGVSV